MRYAAIGVRLTAYGVRFRDTRNLVKGIMVLALISLDNIADILSHSSTGMRKAELEEIRKQGSEIRNEKSGIRGQIYSKQGLEIRDQKLNMRNEKTEMRKQKSEIST